jgi:hypothetical protein
MTIKRKESNEATPIIKTFQSRRQQGEIRPAEFKQPNLPKRQTTHPPKTSTPS